MPTINRPERLKLEGLLAYAHEKHGAKWNIELSTEAWSGDAEDADGIIAYVTAPEDRTRFIRSGRPVVLIEDLLQPSTYPADKNVVTLFCDHESEGRAAASYFLSRHFANFAFVDLALESNPPAIGDRPQLFGDRPQKMHACLKIPEWSAARYRGFEKAIIASRGLDFTKTTLSTQIPRFQGDNLQQLADFLENLPHPTAVFCIHDFRARQVLAAAESRQIEVPRELAILGVDDDEVLCKTVSPALSSIPTGDFRLGYAAGRCLEELMSGRSEGGRVIKLRRARVVSRRSTDADALNDPFVAKALAYARTHLFAKLDLPTLARHVGYSPRMLQLRAERALGHALPEEIRSIRLSSALELIRETDLPIAEIAESCGYTSVSHLAMRIREASGATPLGVRKAMTAQSGRPPPSVRPILPSR